MTSAAARRLSHRIDLTAQACQIDSLSGKHGNRLDCPRQSRSPHDFAGRAVQGERTSGLNTDNTVADHWRRGDHFAHGGFPAQPSGLSFQCIEKTVLAADECQIALKLPVKTRCPTLFRTSTGLPRCQQFIA